MKSEIHYGQWLDDLNLGHPLVIAGPCSAETEEQMLTTAKALKNSDTTIFRAGIWKPRTRPGNFEGIGTAGLPWLRAVKEETGLMTATEVATAKHVEEAEKFDVDVFWIGARTTVNPFMVQEIADALKGSKKPVLVKNPVSPDLALWIGAIERLAKADINNLGAIHRGFSTYKKSDYRNKPEWQIAIDLRSRLENVPLILDASHIAGTVDPIFDLCQTALDLNYNGLMLETHCNPKEAWSDAKQQITPDVLIEYTERLRVRKVMDDAEEFAEKLNGLRAEIDLVDDEIIETMGNRMQIAERIGKLKKESNVAVLQTDRWKEIIGKMTEKGQTHNLSKEFIRRLFKAIHQESINHQESIIKKNGR